jgi:predicted DNA-binding transcriptional regulator AlpA
MERLLTVEEVAELLRTTRSALYSSRHRKEAPGFLGIKVGRRLLWRPSDLEHWLDESGPADQHPQAMQVVAPSQRHR